MVDLWNLLRQRLFFWPENSVSLERILWRRCFTFVSQQEFVILCPKFVILHQKQMRVDLWFALGVLFPPLSRLRVLRVIWEGLAVDTNRLLTELCRIFFNHLAATSIGNLRFSQLGLFILSHSQVALLPLVESLLSIFVG